MTSKILVTGSNGQLGSEIKELSSMYPQLSFDFLDVADLDITDRAMVEQYFDSHPIDYIINCAAYTAVDKAETETDLANKINAEAVRNLLSGSEKHQSKLLHISTDYVFGGIHNTPIDESTATNPESAYGLSKLKGEILASDSGRAIIIRTAWLYSRFGQNFVKTIRKYAKERDSLSVVYDQIGTPTYAADLAKAILDIISKVSDNSAVFQAGIYHYANEGVLSWYDFAIEICNMSQIKTPILPVLSHQYPTPAKRPAYSVLDKQKIKNTFDIKIPYWKDSLRTCIDWLEKG